MFESQRDEWKMQIKLFVKLDLQAFSPDSLSRLVTTKPTHIMALRLLYEKTCTYSDYASTTKEDSFGKLTKFCLLHEGNSTRLSNLDASPKVP